uniref:Uncharacterized protein n=1 Tax=Wuchereria bancrofti TaxID=6293 RepID=A0A1I8F1I0_WUCBA
LSDFIKTVFTLTETAVDLITQYWWLVTERIGPMGITGLLKTVGVPSGDGMDMFIWRETEETCAISLALLHFRFDT